MKIFLKRRITHSRIAEFLFLLMIFSCRKESIDIVSRTSSFYKQMIGTYKLKFLKDKTQITIHFNADSTFKIDSYSTAREYFDGKWYLSDSILIIDIVNWGWIGCLSYEYVNEIDTTGNIEFLLKLSNIDSTGFNAIQLKNNYHYKRVTIQALKATSND